MRPACLVLNLFTSNVLVVNVIYRYGCLAFTKVTTATSCSIPFIFSLDGERWL